MAAYFKASVPNAKTCMVTKCADNDDVISPGTRIKKTAGNTFEFTGNYLSSGNEEYDFEGFVGNWKYIEQEYGYYSFYNKEGDLIYIRPGCLNDGEKFAAKTKSLLFSNFVEDVDYFFGTNALTLCLVHARKNHGIVSIELEKQVNENDVEQQAPKPLSAEKTKKKSESSEKKKSEFSKKKKPESSEKKKPESSEKKKKPGLTKKIAIPLEPNPELVAAPSVVSSSPPVSDSRELSPNSAHQASLRFPVGSKVQILNISTSDSVTDPVTDPVNGIVLDTPTTSGGWYRVRTDEGSTIQVRERALVEVVEDDDVQSLGNVDAEPLETIKKRGNFLDEPKETKRSKIHDVNETVASADRVPFEEGPFLEMLQESNMTTMDMEVASDEESAVLSSFIKDKNWNQEDIMISRLKSEDNNEKGERDHSTWGYFLFNRVLDKVIILNPK